MNRKIHSKNANMEFINIVCLYVYVYESRITKRYVTWWHRYLQYIISRKMCIFDLDIKYLQGVSHEKNNLWRFSWFIQLLNGMKVGAINCYFHEEIWFVVWERYLISKCWLFRYTNIFTKCLDKNSFCWKMFTLINIRTNVWCFPFQMQLNSKSDWWPQSKRKWNKWWKKPLQRSLCTSSRLRWRHCALRLKHVWAKDCVDVHSVSLKLHRQQRCFTKWPNIVQKHIISAKEFWTLKTLIQRNDHHQAVIAPINHRF